MSYYMNNYPSDITENDLTPMTDAQCRRVKAGDEIGFYCSGVNFNGYWMHARVIGHDKDRSALFVQHHAEPMCSLFYREGDDVVKWPKDKSDGIDW